MARRSSRFLRQQKLALVTLGVVVLGALGYLAYITIQDQPLGDFVEGEHYQLIAEPRRVRGDAVEVLEFFSYGCVHCYTLDPDLDDWVASRGDEIAFRRVPLAAPDSWRLLARAYFTLQALELPQRRHIQLFRVIHDGRQALNTPNRIQEFFVDDVGVAEADFTTTFNSSRVNLQVEQADALARRFQVAAVPTLIIQGKYLVRTGPGIGLRRMLDVADHLIAKIQEERANPSPAESAQTSAPEAGVLLPH